MKALIPPPPPAPAHSLFGNFDTFLGAFFFCQDKQIVNIATVCDILAAVKNTTLTAKKPLIRSSWQFEYGRHLLEILTSLREY